MTFPGSTKPQTFLFHFQQKNNTKLWAAPAASVPLRLANPLLEKKTDGDKVPSGNHTHAKGRHLARTKNIAFPLCPGPCSPHCP